MKKGPVECNPKVLVHPGEACNPKVLVYPGKALTRPPLHYGKCTVFFDGKEGLFRIKDCPGSRKTKKVKRGATVSADKAKWDVVVDWLKEFNKH